MLEYDSMPIRNFCIIAHIDHGKSTLADRLLELTNTIPKNKMHPQYLDQNPVSKKRGITIKLAPVKMNYTLNNKTYSLNLIDTPGHVDFSYEVSRTLKAVEGAILLIDAVSGVQAQTLSHYQKARNLNLKIIPVVNKIDLPHAQPEAVAKDLIDNLNFKKEEIHFISAKIGTNVQKLLHDIILKIPPPEKNPNKPFTAFIFDSFYHPHLGAIAFVKIIANQIKYTPRNPSKIKMLATNTSSTIKEIGFFTPGLKKSPLLSAGEIGYIATGVKDLSKVRVGDTIVFPSQKKPSPVPGFKIPKPMIYMGLFPIDNKQFPALKQALTRLSLNDSSFAFSQQSISYLGPGFQVGFLGLLHAEITKERLENEYNLDLIYTSPQVNYLVKKDSKQFVLNNPEDLPSQYQAILQPMIKIQIITPEKYLGAIITLAANKNLELLHTTNLGEKIKLEYYGPLTLLLGNFYDQLKSISSGYASCDWQFCNYKKFPAQKLEVLINNQKIDSLCYLFDQKEIFQKAKTLTEKLKKTIPRQLYEIKIQAAVGKKIIASARIPPFRKDVTSKLYGGDRTRKDKLLKAQKKGKKRLKKIGKIQIPQEAFLAASKI